MAEQNLVARDLLLLAVTLKDHDLAALSARAAPFFYAKDIRSRLDVYALASEALGEQRGCVLVFPREERAAAIQDRHLGSESAKGLGQLTADGSPAYDDKTPGQVGEREHRLVGQETGFVETGYGGARGARTGGHDGAGKAQSLTRDLEGIGCNEGRCTEEDIDAQTSQSVHRIVLGDLGPHPPHALHGRASVGDRRALRRSVLLLGMGLPPGMQEALGGHAPDVQAIASHEMPLDDGNPGPQPGCAHRRDQARCSGPDDHQIIAPRGRGIHPVRRMHIIDERAVVRVIGKHSWRGRVRAICLALYRPGAALLRAHDEASPDAEPSSSSRRKARRARWVMSIVATTVATRPPQ